MRKFIFGLVAAVSMFVVWPTSAKACDNFFTPVTVASSRFGNRVFFTPNNAVFTNNNVVFTSGFNTFFVRHRVFRPFFTPFVNVSTPFVNVAVGRTFFF